MDSDRLVVLYVDDNADIRRIATLALKLDPAIEVTTASSGEEALKLLDESAQRYDLFLFDVMMSGMSGIDLMAQVARRSSVASVPVVLITARAQPADLNEYREAGANGVIIKPFDPLHLAREVRALASPRPTASA